MGFFDKIKKSLIGEATPNEANTSASKVSPSTSTAELPVDDNEDHTGYKAVVVQKSERGWGGPLTVWPSKQKPLIYSVTGGGIHPVAQKIADMTGGTPFDGFKSKADFHEIAVAVIDCGGTARVGVYPMKNVLTIDVHATSPSGPLMKYIKETNFVSGVDKDGIQEHST